MMRGIDISQGSGNVDFFELKKSGIDFVIARAGYGSDVKQKDARFDDYVTLAHAAGLHVGAYWFIYARTIPEAQQNGLCFAQVCEKYKGVLDMPLWVDYENDSTRYYQQETGQRETKDFATAAISVATLELEHAGWYAGYYVNLDYYQNHIYPEKLKQFALWLALWRDPAVRPTVPCGIWQYSGDTKIPYATGGVDLNMCYVDYADVIRKIGLNGFERTEPVIPEPEPPTAAARNIILYENGTWEYT